MVFKLRALRVGAAIASKKLWELNSKLLAQDERNEKEKTRVNVRALASPSQQYQKMESRRRIRKGRILFTALRDGSAI
jgi:hypothetical protein